MRTIKQIADEIGVDKQRVYRFVRKNRINEAHHERNVMYYDEAAEKLINQHFTRSDRITESHHEAHQIASLDTVIDTLVTTFKAELDTKNALITEQQKTIRELTAALENTTASLNAAQALHAGTMQQQIADDDPVKEPEFDGFIIPEINIRPSKLRDFFRRVFRK